MNDEHHIPIEAASQYCCLEKRSVEKLLTRGHGRSCGGLLQPDCQCCAAWYDGWGRPWSRCMCDLWTSGCDTRGGRHQRSFQSRATFYVRIKMAQYQTWKKSYHSYIGDTMSVTHSNIYESLKSPHVVHLKAKKICLTWYFISQKVDKQTKWAVTKNNITYMQEEEKI